LTDSFVGGQWYRSGSNSEIIRNYSAGAGSEIAATPGELGNLGITLGRLITSFGNPDKFEMTPYFDTEALRERVQNGIAPDRDRGSLITGAGQVGGFTLTLVGSEWAASRISVLLPSRVSKIVGEAEEGASTLSRGAELRAKFGDVFDEYMHFRNQGFNPAQAKYLTEPYEGVGHHFPIRQATARDLGLPDWVRDSPLNVLKPEDISTGRFYELHYAVDPNFRGAAFPSEIGGSWSGSRIGLEKYGSWGRWWYGTSTPLKLTGAGTIGAVLTI
jgi:hypothetical protein